MEGCFRGKKIGNHIDLRLARLKFATHREFARLIIVRVDNGERKNEDRER